MVFISEVKKDKEYLIGDIYGKLMWNITKHNEKRIFDSVEEAIKILRKNGNKRDIEVLFLDNTRKYYDYKGNILKQEQKNKHDKTEKQTEDTINNVTKTNVKQYFEYQEELNQLTMKMDKIKTLRDNLKDGLKTDITTVLLSYDYNDTAKIKLTRTGLTITLPVKLYNDYEIIHKIDTELFTQLNKLMGITGKLNITGPHKEAGNQVYTLELIYNLDD